MDATLIDPMVGMVLDRRYRIDGRLAEGGMSTVYAGTDLRLDRTVAIKVMAPGLAQSPAFVERFTREARSVARLTHTNIVSVLDQGTDQGHAFLVMELVRGHTLRDLLDDRGRLTPAEAVAVLEPVLAGLTTAHRSGLIHRDIKPENVLLSDQGVVKVADFGLARALAATNTSTGDVLIGTVAYLSPEQIESGTASARSDVYAAGILLYEMLTGAPPYSGETAISVAYRHVHSDVPAPSRAAPGIPPQLDDLTIDATRREASARPVDAGAFLAELYDVRTDLGLERVSVPVRGSRSAPTVRPNRPVTKHVTRPVTGPPPRRRRRWPAALLVVLLLGLAAGAGGWWFSTGRYTEVPALSLLSAEEATRAAQDAGVDVVFGTEAFSEEVPAGRVIAADPADGARVLRGSEVTITVSQGPERFTVDPALARRPLDDALAALAVIPVRSTQEQAYHEEIPSGAVIGFDPPAGTELRRGDPVTVVVSRGPAPVDVPEVVGMTAEDATAALEGGGLTVAPVEEFSDDIAAGVVIRQAPGPNAGQVERGTTVEIVVSKGPDLVEVPDVVGLTRADAEEALSSAGFEVDSTCFLCGSGGVVNRQDPAGGTLFKRGSTVSILLSFA
ncbi:N/A [soil metagenome]